MVHTLHEGNQSGDIGMSLRIAVGGFLHESHSFAPRPTTYDDFRQPGGFSPFQDGPGLIEALRGRSVPIAGAIAVLEEAGASLIPLSWGFASPAGPIQDEAFERIAAMIGARAVRRTRRGAARRRLSRPARRRARR